MSLINKTTFAELAGVTQGAVTKAIKSGLVISEGIGRSALIDSELSQNALYIAARFDQRRTAQLEKLREMRQLPTTAAWYIEQSFSCARAAFDCSDIGGSIAGGELFRIARAGDSKAARKNFLARLKELLAEIPAAIEEERTLFLEHLHAGDLLDWLDSFSDDSQTQTDDDLSEFTAVERAALEHLHEANLGESLLDTKQIRPRATPTPDKSRKATKSKPSVGLSARSVHSKKPKAESVGARSVRDANATQKSHSGAAGGGVKKNDEE